MATAGVPVPAHAQGAAVEPSAIRGVITADLPLGGPVRIVIAPLYSDLVKGRITREVSIPGPGPFILPDVPPGSYVLVAFMDRNGNGVLDREVDVYAVPPQRIIVSAGEPVSPVTLDTFFNAERRGVLTPEARTKVTQQAALLYRVAAGITAAPDSTDVHRRRGITLQYRMRNVLYWATQPGTEAQHRYLFAQVAATAATLQALGAGDDTEANRRGPMRGAVLSAQFGAPWPYALYVPPAYDAHKTWPLFVFLHGAGANADQALRSVCGAGRWGQTVFQGRDAFPPFPERDVFVLAAYGLTTDDPFDGYAQNVDEVLASIDAVQADYNIDPRRVYLLGTSMGGGGVWRIGLTSPGRFAAIAAISGTLPLSPEHAGDAPQLPALAIHGAHDHVIPIADVRAWMRRRETLGGRAHLRELPDGDHYLDGLDMDEVFAELEALGATRQWGAAAQVGNSIAGSAD